MEKNLNEELESRKTFLSEYYGRDNGRTAVIYQRWAGLEVDFLLNGEVVQHQPLYEHSRQYAEDACENWVEGII
jgi:hypothetical protein